MPSESASPLVANQLEPILRTLQVHHGARVIVLGVIVLGSHLGGPRQDFVALFWYVYFADGCGEYMPSFRHERNAPVGPCVQGSWKRQGPRAPQRTRAIVDDDIQTSVRVDHHTY